MVGAAFLLTERQNAQPLHAVQRGCIAQAIDYDKLTIEVWTDGTINAQEAVSLAARVLIEHLNLFVNLSGQKTRARRPFTAGLWSFALQNHKKERLYTELSAYSRSFWNKTAVGLLLIGSAGIEVCQHGTGDVVPHREHGTRDGGQRVLGKVGGSQAGG